jgi:hypothetical protein
VLQRFACVVRAPQAEFGGGTQCHQGCGIGAGVGWRRQFVEYALVFLLHQQRARNQRVDGAGGAFLYLSATSRCHCGQCVWLNNYIAPDSAFAGKPVLLSRLSNMSPVMSLHQWHRPGITDYFLVFCGSGSWP